ncbi:c-type cytochrome biogenesis protein CcmI [Pikeienuella sp. HZG-20]|uniref:c-type cytochrome biogenesis protein CcmI n=1 Tax=Paludibacillus litoralis TaxID=3133267 RepID=UPI0030EEEC75
MAFWIIAVVAALVAVFIVIRPLLKSRTEAAPRAAHDAQVFRAQLIELDHDIARGLVAEADVEPTRLEISRRLLAADAESRATAGLVAAPAALSRGLAIILVVSAPLAAAALYMNLGAPGAADMPFADRAEAQRPSQEEAERMMAGRGNLAPPAGADTAEFEQLIEQLEERLAETPDDERGVLLYARALMNLSRFDEGWRQYEKLIQLRGAAADASIYAGAAEGMILAAGGYVSPEAEAALLEVLKQEPTNPAARYYLGRLQAQEGAPERAAEIWTRLLDESPPDAPWVAPIRSEMAALNLGPRPRRGDGLPGPTREEMEAAAALPETDRQAMANDMVDRLAERLKTQGGDVAEWRRLIRSYSVLGRNASAQEALKAAEAAFAGDPAALAALRADAPSPPRSGADFSPPPQAPPGAALRGPTEDEIAAAADMAPEDRMEMVRSMVSQLHERLQDEGRAGDVNDWGRLMRSYNVLGDVDAVRAVYDEAIQIYRDDAIGLAYLKEAALLNGAEFD